MHALNAKAWIGFVPVVSHADDADGALYTV